MNDVKIVDTTLRDGEQTAGIVFSAAEKIIIAKMLTNAGVKEIEVGVPAMGPQEQEVIKAIASLKLEAKLISWNRLKLSDIKASIDCGMEYVHISAPVSDIHIQYKLGKNRKWVLDNVKKAVEYARSFGCTVSIGAEDASRADEEFLLRLVETIEKMGVKRLRYADTLGVLDPFSTAENIKKISKRSNLDIEFHAHNDFGMATANTIAAVNAGAKLVSTTVTGIGERAGNASLEEVTIVLKKLFNIDIGIDIDKLPYLSRFVAKAANRNCYVFPPEININSYVCVR